MNLEKESSDEGNKAFVRQHRIADVLQTLRYSGLFNLGTAGADCRNLNIS